MTFRDPLAQRLVAADWAIREHGRAVTLDRGPGAVGELFDRDALVRGVATGEGDGLHRTEFRAHCGRFPRGNVGAGRNA